MIERDSATETHHWEDPRGLVPLGEQDWSARLRVHQTRHLLANAPVPQDPLGPGAGVAQAVLNRALERPKDSIAQIQDLARPVQK